MLTTMKEFVFEVCYINILAFTLDDKLRVLSRMRDKDSYKTELR